MTAFGPSIDAGQVEDAVRDVVLTWIDTYLVDVERQNDLDDRYYLRPRSWRIDDEIRRLAEDVLPAIVVVSPGEVEEPQDRGDGTLDGTLQVGVIAIVKGGKHTADGTARDGTRLMARRYGAAIAKLLDQKGGNLGGAGRLASRPVTRFDELRRATEVTDYVGVAYVSFLVLVEGLRQRDGGPVAPAPPAPGGTPESAPAYPDAPLVSTVDVTVEHI